MTLLRFSRGAGRAAAVVRAVSFSRHAEVGFKLDTGLVLDSTPGLGLMTREAKDDATTLYFDILAPSTHITKALAWARGQAGAPFDWSVMFSWRGRPVWWMDETRWFPSELIAAAFIEAQWPLVRGGQAFDRITPRDLLLSTRIKPVKRGNEGGQ
jgi:hypothetical protein